MVFDRTASINSTKEDKMVESKQLDAKSGSGIAEDVRYRLRLLVREALDGNNIAALSEETATYLYDSCIKLARKNKDDLRIPFRVLKDEIGRCEYTSEASVKERQVNLLFKLYDELEARALEVAGDAEHADQLPAAVLFEELRTRMLRLVVGETWDDATRLRGLALKRIYAYKTKEQGMRRARSVVQRMPSGNEQSQNKLTRALSKKLSGNGAVTVGTWEDTLEELGKAPATKLFPLVKLLLVEVGADPTSHSGVSEPDTPNGHAPGRSVSDTDSITTGMSKVTVDDLLGMDAPVATTAAPNAPPAAAPAPAPLRHPVSLAHGDPWQVPVQPPSMQAPMPQQPAVPMPVQVAPAAYVPAAQSPRYTAFQSSPPALHVAPLRTMSGASEPSGAQSPYFGKKDPLRDNTFADLSPL